MLSDTEGIIWGCVFALLSTAASVYVFYRCNRNCDFDKSPLLIQQDQVLVCDSSSKIENLKDNLVVTNVKRFI